MFPVHPPVAGVPTALRGLLTIDERAQPFDRGMGKEAQPLAQIWDREKWRKVELAQDRRSAIGVELLIHIAMGIEALSRRDER